MRADKHSTDRQIYRQTNRRADYNTCSGGKVINYSVLCTVLVIQSGTAITASDVKHCLGYHKQITFS